MSLNRLHLDFSLQSADERSKFVNEYIQSPAFDKKPLTEDELETIANYMLYGKDPDGLNCTQRKEIQIETRNKTWQRNDTDSLDAIMESPAFNEATIRQSTEARTKISRETFSREKALKECPPHMIPLFEDLFLRIDTLELGIHFYEYAHGRRKEPPRDSLLSKFAADRIEQIKEQVSHWNQYKYLKQRHQIVELRREQFTMRDQYIEKVLRHSYIEPDFYGGDAEIESEIPVYPLGVKNGVLGALAFKDKLELYPKTYTAAEQEKLVKFLWQKREDERPPLYFDFEELEHVYELFRQLNELEMSTEDLPVESNLKQLLDTLRYYIDMTDLTDIQLEVLQLKIDKIKNQDIADQINKKYGKSYTANYISTIFRQKIIPKINEAAKFHATIIENICYEENFKRCNCCKKMLLISPENFVRKSRSKDGFSTKCKICDRESRQAKKKESLNDI